MKFLWRIFVNAKHGNSVLQKLRNSVGGCFLLPTYRNCKILWEAVLFCRPAKIGLNSVGGSTSLLRHRNDSRLPKHDREVGTVASFLSKIGKEELASAVVRWVPSSSIINSSSCATVAGAAD